jgi:hypothetical protein
MSDSRSEDPPDGGLMQQVVASFSARRQQQPTAATRRSAPLVTPVTFPNLSFASRRFSARPDPDAPRANAPGPGHLTPSPIIHPNVETRRGTYGGGNYSILASISGSFQRQVRHIEEEFEAVIVPDDPTATPPSQISIPTPDEVASYMDGPPTDDDLEEAEVESDNERYFDTAPPPDFDNASRSSISQITSMFGSLFNSHTSPVPVVTPSLHQDDAGIYPPSLEPEAGPYPPPTSRSTLHPDSIESRLSDRIKSSLTISDPVKSSSTIAGSLPPTPVNPAIWYNTGPSIISSCVGKSRFETLDLTAFNDNLNGTTWSFRFRISSSPSNVEWALQAGPSYDLLHNFKGDLNSNSSRHPARLILIGQCRKTQLLFGARVNLESLVCQPFPLLLRDIGPDPVVVLHPYLHGYHGLEDHGQSLKRGLYAVPVSWCGQRTASYRPLKWVGHSWLKPTSRNAIGSGRFAKPPFG